MGFFIVEIPVIVVVAIFMFAVIFSGEAATVFMSWLPVIAIIGAISSAAYFIVKIITKFSEFGLSCIIPAICQFLRGALITCIIYGVLNALSFETPSDFIGIVLMLLGLIFGITFYSIIILILSCVDYFISELEDLHLSENIGDIIFSSILSIVGTILMYELIIMICLLFAA